MNSWVNDLVRALETAPRAVIVTVAHTSGSTPREAGAAMIVTAARGYGGFVA